MTAAEPLPRSAAPPAGDAALEAPPEPLALKERVRRRVLERPDTLSDLAREGSWLADWLWSQWAPTLCAWGLTREALRDVVAGYHHELWLWLMGERPWAHVADALAGRAQRRATRRAAAASDKSASHARR